MIMPTQKNLNREKLIKRIEFYGFNECGCILSFLHNVCSKSLDMASYRFIYEKLKECLSNHYDGNEKEYFKELTQLQSEIEFILSVSHSS